jgi:hypothetical protein
VFWRRQNRNIVNALIVGIRRFINDGVPIGGISILLAHTAILSRNWAISGSSADGEAVNP